MRLPQGSRTKISKKIASEVFKLRRLFSFLPFSFLLSRFFAAKANDNFVRPRLTRNEANNLSYRVFT